MQLSLHSVKVILIFTVFVVVFSLKYIMELKLWCARMFWRQLYSIKLLDLCSRLFIASVKMLNQATAHNT